ncbi:MAG: hypothetical protein JOZ41_08435 [Chloroflexi bacterium]|nr:hypothetical protein [Chloroflexota bacterium]
MSTQQETVSGTGQGIDNLTYDLITVIHEKSKGLEAYDRYMQDAQGNQQVSGLFQQIRQQDQQAVQQLTQALQQVLGGSQ